MKKLEWLDYTDYCPSSYGFEDEERYEPLWRFVCPNCDTHFTEEDGACENFPVWNKECPVCKCKLGVRR